MNGRSKLALCVLLIAMAACAKSEWQELAVGEGGFSVLMRGQPQYARQALDTPEGRMEAHLYSSDRPDAYFAVGYTDYPLGFALTKDPQEILSGVRDTWVRRINGRLVATDATAKVDKYPGLTFTARGSVKDVDAFLEARLYLVDQRLYQLVAIGRTTQVAQGTVNRFFNSFRLTETAQTGTIHIEPTK
jgi:hypothetical protein